VGVAADEQVDAAAWVEVLMESKSKNISGEFPQITRTQIKAGKTRVQRVFLVIGIIMSALMFFAMYDMYQKGNIAGGKAFFISWLGTFFVGAYIIILFSKRIERVLTSKDVLPKDAKEYVEALRRGGLKFRWHILLATGCAFIIVLVFTELLM